MDTEEQIIKKAYDAFNSRDIDSLLQLMDKDVRWPMGFVGGFVTGHENIRGYWTKQWTEIDPNVDPVGFDKQPDGTVAVDVHQVVNDLQGNRLADDMIKHIYTFKNGLITEMNIER